MRVIRITILIFLLLASLLISACNQEKIPSHSSTPVNQEQEIKDSGKSISSTVAIKPEVNFKAPNFVYSLDEKETSILDAKGKPIFINFWAYW